MASSIAGGPRDATAQMGGARRWLARTLAPPQSAATTQPRSLHRADDSCLERAVWQTLPSHDARLAAHSRLGPGAGRDPRRTGPDRSDPPRTRSTRLQPADRRAGAAGRLRLLLSEPP